MKRIKSQVQKRQIFQCKKSIIELEKKNKGAISHAYEKGSRDKDVEMEEQMSKDIENDKHNENNQDMTIKIEVDDNNGAKNLDLQNTNESSNEDQLIVMYIKEHETDQGFIEIEIFYR